MLYRCIEAVRIYELFRLLKDNPEQVSVEDFLGVINPIQKKLDRILK